MFSVSKIDEFPYSSNSVKTIIELFANFGRLNHLPHEASLHADIVFHRTESSGNPEPILFEESCHHKMALKGHRCG